MDTLSQTFRRFKLSAFLFALVLNQACALPSSVSTASPTRQVASVTDPHYDYAQMFELTREVMTRKNARAVLTGAFAEELKVNPALAARYGFGGISIPGFTETQMMLLLQENPDMWGVLRDYLKAVPRDAVTPLDTPELKAVRKEWQDRFKVIFKDPLKMKSFFVKNNPLEPFTLETADGSDGYRIERMLVGHPITFRGKKRPAADLEADLVAFIDAIESEAVFNVFDFDSEPVADAFIRAHRRGVDLRGGIDAGVIKARPEVQAIYTKLIAAGIPVMAVVSVGLNHQKLVASDWSKPGRGRAHLLSGNYTRSCIGAQGDLTRTGFSSPKAVPNANHSLTVKSDLLSLVIHHELMKTIDPAYALRGRDYPLSGAYRIFGAGTGENRNWLTIAFTPNGALRNVNQNVIGRMLRETEGPVYMTQFAFSSKDTNAALLERAAREMKTPDGFQFMSVGDPPFALQDWSVFLSMSGMKLERTPAGKKYVELSAEESPWLKLLGKPGLDRLRKNIRIASSLYGTSSVTTPTGKVQVTAKNHHKTIVSGRPGKRLASDGSFNVSDGAENNQEYIVVYRDEGVTEVLESIVRTQFAESQRSVYEDALRRNKSRQIEPDVGPEVDGPKAGRSGADAKQPLPPGERTSPAATSMSAH